MGTSTKGEAVVLHRCDAELSEARAVRPDFAYWKASFKIKFNPKRRTRGVAPRTPNRNCTYPRPDFHYITRLLRVEHICVCRIAPGQCHPALIPSRLLFMHLPNSTLPNSVDRDSRSVHMPASKSSLIAS